MKGRVGGWFGRGRTVDVAAVALVCLAALTTVHIAASQDTSRVSLTAAIAQHGSLEIPSTAFDKAVFAGRTYSDKAPGVSLLALPAYELERAAGVAQVPDHWASKGDLSLWALRLFSGGLLFLLAVLAVRAGAESLEPGTGAPSAVIFGAGTLAASLAATVFGHVGAGALGLAAFLLARRPTPGRVVLAGALAGLAVVVEYQAALLWVAAATPVALRAWRRLGWYVLGTLPAAAILATYDALAFGSPFHLSYRYVANQYGSEQKVGVFGIGTPSWHGLREVLVGGQGLLTVSPVLVLAAAGLWLLWRRGDRVEAATAAAVTVAFVLVDAGYFLPYGGSSPGPRFLVPALPFLALGLGPALRRWPVATLGLGAVSVLLTTGETLTWALRRGSGFYPGHGTSDLAVTVWAWFGLNRLEGGFLVFVAAFAALAVGALRLFALPRVPVRARTVRARGERTGYEQPTGSPAS